MSTTADELLAQLRRRAAATEGEGGTDGTGDVLGPDLFGRRTAVPAPDFPAGRHAYGRLAPAQVLRFFALLNLLGPAPTGQQMDPASWEPAEPTAGGSRIAAAPPGRPRTGWSPRQDAEPLPESIASGIPKVWFTIWTGWGANRVLRPVGRSAVFWEQIAKSTREHQDVMFVHLTEATRAEIRDAAAHEDVRRLAEWAEGRGIVLVNIHELLAVDQSGWVRRTLLARRSRRDGPSLGEFSDLLRLWLVYLFGGLYLDGNKELRSPTVFEDVAASVPGFGVTEGKNAGILAYPRHPILHAMLERVRANYRKDQVRLARDGLTYQGIDLDRPSVNVALRLPVIERTGPALVRRTLLEAGWSDPPNPRDAPAFPIPFHDPLQTSWLRNDPEPPRTPSGEEIDDTVADITNRLVADLDDARGHLDLVAIEPMLAELPHPEDALAAALSFLASREELRTRIRGVFDHSWDYDTATGAYSLTPFAYRHVSAALLHHLPHLPSLIGDEHGTWMLHKKATRAILPAPGRDTPTPEELAAENTRERPDDFGLRRLPDDPWPRAYRDEAFDHLPDALGPDDLTKARVVLTFIASVDRSHLASQYFAPENIRQWRRRTADLLDLPDHDASEPLPLPGPEARLLFINALNDHGVVLPTDTASAIVRAIAHIHRRHFAAAT